MERDLEKMLRDALDVESPANADARICAAISLAAATVSSPVIGLSSPDAFQYLVL